MKRLIAERQIHRRFGTNDKRQALYSVKPHLAEKLGQEVYGVDGGQYLQKIVLVSESY